MTAPTLVTRDEQRTPVLAVGTPPSVRRPRLARPDELEPRLGPVGAAGLRLAATRPPRVGPDSARSVVVLLHGGVQGPARVVEVRSTERTEVGATRHQDRVHVV